MIHDFWKDAPEIEKELERVDNEIYRSVSSAHGFIKEHIQDLITQQGKKLRPACVLLSYQIVSEKLPSDTVYRLAAGVELIHLASLIHDDIIDDADRRRGKPALHAKIGNKKAIVAGDFLLAKAFSLLSREEVDSLNPSVVSQRITRLCESEIDQDSEIGDYSISKSHYLRRIAGKTASLFSLSCYVGAQAGEASRTTVMLLSRLGYNIGMAFQIRDDILDYSGDSRNLGKAIGKDLESGIATLPLILALKNERSNKRDSLHSHLSSFKQSNVDSKKRIIKLIHDLKGVENSQNMVDDYLRLAKRDLKKLTPNTANKTFHWMMNALLESSL